MIWEGLFLADFCFFVLGVFPTPGTVFLEEDFFFGVVPVPDGGVIPALASLAFELNDDSRSFFGHFFLRFLFLLSGAPAGSRTRDGNLPSCCYTV